MHASSHHLAKASLLAKMKGKIVVSAVSIILVVGVVIGVVVGVKKYGSDAKTQENLSEQMKAINAVCSPTAHKDLCVQSLSKTAANGTSDPKQLIHAAVSATVNSLKNSINFTSTLNSTKPLVQMAIEDCKEMLDDAVERVQTALSLIGESDLQNVNDHVVDLQTWLSSVIAYDASCILGFQENKHKEYMPEMDKNLQDPRQLSGTAIAILSELSNIVSAFGIKLNDPNPNPNSRRLLTSDDEYPTWLSAADRKLLADVDMRKVVPNAVVAHDGSGRYRTINDALKAYRRNPRGRFIIYVKAGRYQEYVTVGKGMANIFMYGDGPDKTIVTGSRSYTSLYNQYKHTKNETYWTTWRTATFKAMGMGFLCKSMGFENSAGPDGHQAVAIRVTSEMSAFFNCGFYGHQDTLYALKERQFYRECIIHGTVDFIFGMSKCIIQNSRIVVRRGLRGQTNAVTAQGAREIDGFTTGIVIQNCHIVADPKLLSVIKEHKTFLGRPWGPYATTVFMESHLGDFIDPLGYTPWPENGGHTDKGYLAEYNNRGSSANIRGRVKWPAFKGLISREEVLRRWTASSLLGAHQWLKDYGVPYTPGLNF